MRFTLSNPMPPPWLRYPWIPLGSIGWRMGFGEAYWLEDWGPWLDNLPEADRKRYRELFPEPACWSDFLGYWGKEPVQLWEKEGKPRYNREMLIAAAKKQKPLFFWKPEPGVIGKGCLGQWQPTPFREGAERYSCAEQYMMVWKARLFGDDEIREKIMASRDPKRIKALGREVRGFDEAIWRKASHSIVLNGNYLKFTQDEQLRAFLLGTGNRLLVEASPIDRIWGIGLDSEHPDAANPAKWRGENRLGFALMEVRDEIARVWANVDRIDWSRFRDE